MKKQIKIISIVIILMLTVLTVNVSAQGILQTIHNGLLRAFALYASETEASINVISSYSEFNEETENDDITINVETLGLADGTEISLSLQGYTLENEEVRRRVNIYCKR